MSKASRAPSDTLVRNPQSKGLAKTKITPRQRDEGGEGKVDKHWRTYFLQSLAETSNVTAAAAAAGVCPSRAYKARREHAGFLAAWRAALVEGYEHLEMEALGYLRCLDPDRKMDVGAALRLLAAHKDTVARERARENDRDEQDVIDSIDAMLDEMRGRRSAHLLALSSDSEPIEGADVRD